MIAAIAVGFRHGSQKRGGGGAVLYIFLLMLVLRLGPRARFIALRSGQGVLIFWKDRPPSAVPRWHNFATGSST